MFSALRGPHLQRPSFAEHFRRFSRHCRRFQLKGSRVLGKGPRWALLGGAGGVVVVASASQKQEGGEAPNHGIPRTRTKTLSDFGHPLRRTTDALLVINCVCFALQWLSKDLLTFWGAKVNSYIFAGQWWRLITPALLHSSLFHLAINSHALNSIGPQMELLGGHARFIAVYAVSALAGTVASVLMTPAPSIGSSGAIFGLGAALGLYYWRHRDLLGSRSDNVLKSLGVTIVINLAYSIVARNIDNWGHLGGALGGALVALLLGPRFRLEDNVLADKPPLPWLAFRPVALVPAAPDTSNKRRGKPAKQLPKKSS